MAWDYSKGLRIRWGKRERGWMIDQPNGPDGHLAAHFIGGHLSTDFPRFLKELEERGYDLTTLRLVVKRKPKEA